MSWGSNSNPVAVGDTTKKAHYDDVWDKLQYIKDSVIPAATKMLFGQSSAPTGWTKDTATWTDDSMIVFTTGSISSGGSGSPSAAHSHALQNSVTAISGGTGLASSEGPTVDSGLVKHAGLDGGTYYFMSATTTSHTPKYQKVIAATKDTYT